MNIIKSNSGGAASAKHGRSKIIVQILAALFIIASFGYLFGGVLHYLSRFRA